MGIRRVAGLNWNRLLMRVYNTSAGKGASSMVNFASKIDRMDIKLLKRLQRVIVVDGATHSQKDDVEDNGDSFKDGAEAFYAVPVWLSAGSAV